MARQRHIGLLIFAVCSALAAKLAVFEPQPHKLTPAEERWGPRQTDEGDAFGIIHGVRYYIYGLGVLGLLMEVEDYVGAKSRQKKRAAQT